MSRSTASCSRRWRSGSRRYQPTAGPGRVAALAPGRPERPLLERRAAALVVEGDDPEVAVVPAPRCRVLDLQAHHAGVPLDGDDLAVDRELLPHIGLAPPELLDRVDAGVGIHVRRAAVARAR